MIKMYLSKLIKCTLLQDTSLSFSVSQLGIICYEKLEDMLKLVSSQVVKKDGKYVVQKYMGQFMYMKFFVMSW